jgi:hypothetical protein
VAFSKKIRLLVKKIVLLLVNTQFACLSLDCLRESCKFVLTPIYSWLWPSDAGSTLFIFYNLSQRMHTTVLVTIILQKPLNCTCFRPYWPIISCSNLLCASLPDMFCTEEFPVALQAINTSSNHFIQFVVILDNGPITSKTCRRQWFL